MTGDELRQRYRIVRVVTEDGVRTCEALDGDSRLVMMHQLPADPAESARLLALVDALGPMDQKRFVRRLDVDGATVLITEQLLEFHALPRWLAERATRRSSPAVPPPPPPPAAAPGEFTGIFGAASAPTPPPPQPRPRTEQKAGELTGLFGSAADVPTVPNLPSRPAAAKVPEPPAPPPPAPPAPPPPPSGDKPVVRWREGGGAGSGASPSDRPAIHWKGDASSVPPPPPPPPAPPREPPKQAGEMTRLFGPSGGEGATAPPGGPAAPQPPKAKEPGEFTRLFQAGRKPGYSAPPPPPPSTPPHSSAPPAGPPSDYLRALNTPTPGGGGAPRVPSVPPLPAPSQPLTPPAAPDRAPGEFTRLLSGTQGSSPGNARAGGGGGGGSDFSRIIATAPSSAPRPAAEPEQPAADAELERPRFSPRLLVLIIALSVLGIAAVGLVLYYALKGP